MVGDLRILFGFALSAVLIVYGVLQLPPLTNRGASGSTAINQATFDAVYGEELDHCEGQSESYDCRCFARISGVVQAGEQINIPGATRPDRKELARMQAAGSC